MAHHIFASDESEADMLASAFEHDGYAVRWARHRPGQFIELEVGETPSVLLATRVLRDER